MLELSEYVKVVRRPYPPFLASLFWEGMADTRRYQKAFPRSRFTTKDQIKLTDGSIYYSLREVKAGGELIMKYWDSSAEIRRIWSLFNDAERKLVTTARGKDLRKYAEAYLDYTPAITVFMGDAPVATAIRQKLEEKVGTEKTDIFLDALNVPLKDNFYKQEEYDLALTKDLERHVKKYEWIRSRYGSKHAYTIVEAKDKLQHIDKAVFLKNRTEGKERLRKVIKEAKQVLGKDSYLVDLMQFIIYYRTHRTDVFNKAAYLSIPLLENVAAEKGISYDELLYAAKDELLDTLPSKEILRSRMKCNVVIIDRDRVKTLTGPEAEKIEEYFSLSIADTESFMGQAACKGKVTGSVVLVKKRDDLARVNESSVLVTSMTTPEMVPALKKAAAFITDEGGITCHAAIISRELKKPCIIGTKIATKALRDGMKVEVNADEGIIKIL